MLRTRSVTPSLPRLFRGLSSFSKGSCSGCGAQLQSKEPSERGYQPARREGAAAARFCQRCHRLKHYGQLTAASVDEDDLQAGLAALRRRQKQSLVLNVVDVYDFHGSLLRRLEDTVGSHTDRLLVLNKCDLLPHGTSLPAVREWAWQLMQKRGVRVRDVLPCSSVSRLGMDAVIDALRRHRDGRDLWVVGSSNAGKSTFVTQLLRQLSVRGGETVQLPMAMEEEESELYSEQPPPPVTSPFPGTTLGVLRFPMGDGSYLYDTPGVEPHASRDRLFSLLAEGSPTAKAFHRLVPSKRQASETHLLSSGKSLFVAGLARIDYQHDSGCPLLFSWHGAAPCHATATHKADALWKRQVGKLLAPPDSDSTAKALGDMRPLRTVELSKYADEDAVLHRAGRMVQRRKRRQRSSVVDIELTGLGWFSVTPVEVDGLPARQKELQGGRVRVSAVDGIAAFERPPLLPKELSGSRRSDWKKN